MSITTFILTTFASVFAIANPLAMVPIFLGLAGEVDGTTKRRIARRACVTAFFIILAFILVGQYIFQAFGITMPAFQITGGLLIFYIGFGMLQSRKAQIHNVQDPATDEDIAVSPLAIPMIAGPGTLVVAMHYASDASPTRIGVLVAVVAADLLLMWLAMYYSNVIARRIGNNLMTVIAKLMGLIVAIIGTTMVISGVQALT